MLLLVKKDRVNATGIFMAQRLQVKHSVSGAQHWRVQAGVAGVAGIACIARDEAGGQMKSLWL
jgi:hypothetical protein